MTKKGKYGITLKTYAVLAFVLALLGQTLLCALLLAFVIAKEEDEWAIRQCMQAFFVTFASVAIVLVSFGAIMLGVVTIAINETFGAIVTLLMCLLPGILSVILFIFEIMGLARVAKGQEANIPILSGWAYRAFGYVKQRPAPPQGTVPPPYPPYGHPGPQPGPHPGQPGYYPPQPGAPVPPMYPQPPMGQAPVNGPAYPPQPPVAPPAPEPPPATEPVELTLGNETEPEKEEPPSSAESFTLPDPPVIPDPPNSIYGGADQEDNLPPPPIL